MVRSEDDVCEHLILRLDLPVRRLLSSVAGGDQRTRKKLTRGLLRFIVAVLVIFLHHHNENNRHSNMAFKLKSGSHKSDVTMKNLSCSIKSRTASLEEFSSANHFLGPHGQIAFRLHQPNDKYVNFPEKYELVSEYLCKNTSDLPFFLAQSCVLGFRVSISTSLKLVFIGDSIAGQLAQTFDTSVLDLDYIYSQSIKSHFTHKNKDIHVCVAESAPIRGGGVSAYMRNNYMVSSDSMRQHVICEHGQPNWGLNTVYSLLDHQYSVKNHNHSNKPFNVSMQRVGRFDAAILEIPYGWIKDINLITKERIIEEVNLVGKYFGAETLIISTIAMKNNVKTLGRWQGVIKVNEIIREIASSWAPPQAGSDGVHWVLVQEFANYTNQLIWTNAKHIGCNVSSLEFSSYGWEGQNAEFLMDWLQNFSRFWPPSVPMICAEKPRDGTSCAKNKISPDGGHWCIATLGPRYSASIACLLGCVYNGNWIDFSVDMMAPRSMNKNVRLCEQECNDQFMSLVPVHEKWIKEGTILYSSCDLI
ncbi:hypothetical protein ACHAW6_002769 [Cyclotella cf. meneghiniana]